MSTNLATILVGLGYDLSALEKGAPEAFRLINQQTLGMSAEMKRSSREGAESWRLIDEALGIHVSRPLTRIVTQEFPALGKALQSVLAVGVVGGLGVALFEGYERAARSIENAQKAQEAFGEATEKTKTQFDEVMASYEKAEKLRSLSGLSLELFKIDTSSIEQARKHIDDLAAAFVDLNRKQEEASGWWSRTKAFIGDEAHRQFNTPTELATEKLQKQFDDVRKRYDELSKQDALKGTADSARYIAGQLATARVLLDEMSAHQMTGFETFLRNQIPTPQTGQMGFSADEVETQKKFLSMLQQMNDEQKAAGKDKAGADEKARSDAAIAAMEKERTSIREQDAAIQKWAQSLEKIHAATLPAKDAIAQLDAELQKQIISFTNLYNTIGADAWFVKFHENYGQVIQDLTRANAQKEASIRLDELMQKGLPGGAAGIAKFPSLAAGALSAPTLGAGGSVGAQFDVFSKDQTAQLKAAAQAYQDLITPQQKYELAQKELNELLRSGLIDQQAFTAAMQKAREEMLKSENQIERMLKEGGAAGGLKAFMMQLQGEGGKGSDAQFTFDLLNKGLQGFEDETVKALTGAKTNWASFFESLDQMALKFMLNKLFAQLLNGAGGLFGGLGAGGGGAAPGELASSFTGSGFASGTDSAPGGLAWVGENGPELMNVPAGASITPTNAITAALKSPSVAIHIDARGGEIGVEEKIARAISASAPQLIMRAVAEASEVRRRTPS